MEKNVLGLSNTFANMLKGDVIVVTGAGSGLGKAISLGLVFAGAKVGLLDINKAAISEVADKIKSVGGEAFVMEASVTDEAQLEKVYSELFKKFGKIDGLINAAGIARLGRIQDLTPRDIKLSNDVNIDGYFLNTLFASKKMVEAKKGVIINISSASARGISQGSSLYGTAKEAQCMMVRQWAMDLGPSRVRVNALILGDLFGDEKLGINSAIWGKEYFNKKAVDKGLVQASDPRLNEEILNPEIREKVVDHYVARSALSKELTYQDVVSQIIFMCSSFCSKMTGESIALTSGNPSAFSR